jgi:hypothetical protein
MLNETLFLLIKANKKQEALILINNLKNASFKKQSNILNYYNQHHENCVMEAAFRGEVEVLQALNTFSVISLHSKNILGNNALMLSILNEKENTLNYILNMSHLDELLKTNNQKNNIIHLALSTKNEKIIETVMLHLKNAYPFRPLLLQEMSRKKNKDSLTAIDLALELNLDIFFKLSDMIKPLFLLKKQDVKNQLI